MKILSIQVGRPKEIPYNGSTMRTSIFKSKVSGPVQVNLTHLSGDEQADLRVHGGPDKAVYAFSYDAYPWWRKARPQDVFEYGAFGENLTVDHLPEDQLYVGDTFEIGSSILQVCQPRFPCAKLAAMYNDIRMPKTFMQAGRPGVYFRVLKEGEIDCGQELKLIAREKILLSISDWFRNQTDPVITPEKARQYINIQALTSSFRKKLEVIAAGEDE